MNTNTINNKKRNITVAGVIVLALAVVAALVVGFNSSSNKADAKSSKNAKDRQALINLLTVKTSTVDCAQLVNATGGNTMAYHGKTQVGLKVDALKGTPPRKWGDAISTPLKGKSPPDKFTAQQSAICQDPLLGVTTAHMLAGLVVDGVHVVDQNNWLKPFVADASEINDAAAGFVPLLDATTPSDKLLEKAAKANLDYQELAGKLDTLLKRFHLDGIDARQSTKNWHLAGGGLSVGGLPEVALNKHQENLPALVLSVRLKDVCVPASLVGFNVGDKRPEVFGTQKCGSKPTTSTPGTKGPKPTPHKKPKCVPPSIMLPQGVCSEGKNANQAPVPTGGPVIHCPNGYLGRDGKCHSGTYTPPSNGGGSSGGSQGQGDSGPGATNTTAPPPTTGPAPAPPQTSSPPTPVPTPTF